MTHHLSGSFFVSVVVGLSVALGASSQLASSQTIGNSVCPSAWINVIEQVAEARARLPKDSNGVIMVGFDGEIYNCLDEQVPLEEMERIRFFEGSLALLRANMRAQDSNEETGICDCGFHTTENGYGINICSLPYDHIELNGENCAKRLKLYLKNLKSN